MVVGSIIRRLRRQQSRTLQEIGDICGFSRSLLSKIETGKTTPPVATLMKIASALGASLPSLLDVSSDNRTVFTPRAMADDLALTHTEKGYGFSALASGRSDKQMQPILFVAEKGRFQKKPMNHAGEEFVFMLEGQMKYSVGHVEHHLHPGDSLYFDATEDHDLEPVTDRVVFLGIFQLVD